MYSETRTIIDKDAPIIFDNDAENFYIPDGCIEDAENPNLYIGIESDHPYTIFGIDYHIHVSRKAIIGYRYKRDGFIPVKYGKLPVNTYPLGNNNPDCVIISEISNVVDGKRRDTYDSDNMFLKTRNSVPFVVYAKVTKSIKIIENEGRYEKTLNIEPLMEFLGYDMMHTNKNGVTTFSRFDPTLFNDILEKINESFVYPEMCPRANIKPSGKQDFVNPEEIYHALLYKIGMEQMVPFEMDEYIAYERFSETKTVKFFGYFIPENEN